MKYYRRLIMRSYCSSTYIYIDVVMYSQQEVSTNDNLKNSDETTKKKPHKEKNQTVGVKKNEKSKPERSLEKKGKKKKVLKVHEHQNKEEVRSTSVCVYTFYILIQYKYSKTKENIVYIT